MGKTLLAYGRGTGKPHPVDVHVGARVRMRRTLLGMSQTTLGEAIGLTFQQVQKYERGPNRIGASRLFELSWALDVPVEYFFDEMPAEVSAIWRPQPYRCSGRSLRMVGDPVHRGRVVAVGGELPGAA